MVTDLVTEMDTINIRLSAENCKGIDLMKETPQYLTNVSKHYFEGGNTAISGRFGNFKATVTERSLKIKDGSLTKWYLGDNLKIMSRGDIQRAFEKMSDELHLPIHKAEIIRFDFGKNIVLNNDVNLYLHYLGNNGRYVRCEQPSGINYKMKNRELCLYDKIREMKHRREYLLPLYQNSNVIRIEKKYLSGLCKQFNQNYISTSTLYDEAFYTTVTKDWYKDFTNIQKINLFKIDISMITKVSELETLGILALVQQQGGELAFIQNINERYKKGELTKKQAHDLREQVKKSCTHSLQTYQSDLVQELEQKVAEAVRYYR